MNRTSAFASTPSTPFDGRQRGAVLVISLILLLVLTMLGTSSMRTTGIEEIMAGNQRDQQLSFQGTEAAVRAGEAWVNASPVNRSAADGHNPLNTPGTWDGANPNPTGIFDINALAGLQLAQNPVFHVAPPVLARDRTDMSLDQSELLCRPLYQVTGRSLGITADANLVIRSAFAPPAAGKVLCPNN